MPTTGEQSTTYNLRLITGALVPITRKLTMATSEPWFASAKQHGQKSRALVKSPAPR